MCIRDSSKALPYIVISIFMVFLAHPIVGLMYGLWPKGNVGMMIVGTMLYVLACLLYTSCSGLAATNACCSIC